MNNANTQPMPMIQSSNSNASRRSVPAKGHTVRLPSSVANELETVLCGQSKSDFIREAVEEKIVKAKSLRFLLESEDEIVERLKLRIDQAVEDKLKEVEGALIGSVGALNSLRSFSEALTTEYDEFKEMMAEAREETEERAIAINQLIGEVDETRKHLLWMIAQLCGTSDGASGKSGFNENPFAPTLKR